VAERVERQVQLAPFHRLALSYAAPSLEAVLFTVRLSSTAADGLHALPSLKRLIPRRSAMSASNTPAAGQRVA
jgi:hypothetical protein